MKPLFLKDGRPKKNLCGTCNWWIPLEQRSGVVGLCGGRTKIIKNIYSRPDSTCNSYRDNKRRWVLKEDEG